MTKNQRIPLPPPAEWPTPPPSRIGLRSGLDDVSHISFSLWIVEAAAGPSLAYGWAIPSRTALTTPWSRQDVAKVAARRLSRLSVVLQRDDAFRLLQLLWAGSTLGEAASTVGNAFHEQLPGATLRLGESGDVWMRYAATPWNVMPHGSAPSVGGPWYLRPRLSPNPHAPAIGTALVLREKASLLAELAPTPEARDSLLESLAAETGLAFGGHATERLGDVEVFLFPAANLDERPRASVHLAPHPTVSIELPEGTPLAVRCVQRAAGMILADELKSLRAVAGTTTIEFEGTPDGPHPTVVQVWAGADGALWFAEERIAIRRIGLKGHLLGGSVDLESTWLKSWANNKRHRENAARMKRIDRPSADRGSTIGEPDADFITSAWEGRRWSEKLHPKKSGSRFFPKGERLAFAMWLRDMMARGNDIAAVALFDPFIDGWGIEMFARIENPDCRFEIVTALKRPDEEERVRARLRDILHDLHLPLQGLRLRLRALSGKPFHDRVVLAFDAAENVVRGFQLSNSLEGATKDFSLLITPIPEDVLSEVAREYIELLVRAPLPEEVLHDSTVLRSAPRPRRAPAPSNSTPEAATDRLLEAPPDEIPARWLDFAAALYHRHDSYELTTRLIELASRDVFDALAGWLENAVLIDPQPEGVGDVATTKDALIGVAICRQTFLEAVGHARYALERPPSHQCPYPVELALRVLLRGAPDRFRAVIDSLARRAEDVTAQDAQIGTVLGGAVAALSETLIFRPTSGVAEMCFASSIPFLRALAGAALGAVVTSPSEQIRRPIAEILPALTHLPVTERVRVVAEWISRFRVGTAEFERGSTDQGLDQKAALNALIEWWTTELGEDVLTDVVRRAEGPFAGPRSAHTNLEFLVPLVESGKATPQGAARVWLGLLAQRVLTPVDGIHFSAESDAKLTEVAAQVFATSGEPQDLRPWESAAKVARRAVIRPFARAQHQRFSIGADRLMWLEAFARRVLAHAPAGSPSREVASRIVAQASDLPDYVLHDRREASRGDLVEFLLRSRADG